MISGIFLKKFICSDFDQDLANSCKKLRFTHHHGFDIGLENGHLSTNPKRRQNKSVLDKITNEVTLYMHVNYVSKIFQIDESDEEINFPALNSKLEVYFYQKKNTGGYRLE